MSPGPLPEGEPVPSDGSLPRGVIVGKRPLSFYVHVPFCASRCGYCDFNTYTADELGEGVTRATYADDVIAEIAWARRVLGDSELPVQTVFFGGGTPTLLPPEDLARILAAIDGEFGLATDAEVTTEANPDSVDASSLAQLRDAGFTRMSFGMQSAVPHVLAVLERTHTSGRSLEAVRWARQAGFEHVSLDLIYGTPGESSVDWRTSVEAAVAADVDHVSAYALVVEDGTRLAVKVRRGDMTEPDDDEAAERYEVADALLSAAGFDWYEVSNWAKPGGQCRHNLAYWRGDDWWGAGPGAHSHVDGVRWWNVRHPGEYARRVRAGVSPGAGREVLTAADRNVEALLLGIRLREGVSLSTLHGRMSDIAELVADGLVDGDEAARGRLELTLRGRLLADRVVHALT
ncbi:MAG: radical SAM family heme chaperone HemW [Actinomycetes bacterium]